MSGFILDITTDSESFDAVRDNLDRKMDSLGIAAFLSSVVDPFLRNRIDSRFQSEGDEVSGRWHPLAQATQQIRASYGYPPNHPINVRTGKLRSHLVGTRSDVQANGMGATLIHPPPGSGDPVTNKKIKTAQSGSSHPPTPARPVIGINENDLIFITSSLTAYLSQDFI